MRPICADLHGCEVFLQKSLALTALRVRAQLPRQMHLVQRDLAHLGLASLYVGAQQQSRLVAAFALDGAQDLAVLVIRGGDA